MRIAPSPDARQLFAGKPITALITREVAIWGDVIAKQNLKTKKSYSDLPSPSVRLGSPPFIRGSMSALTSGHSYKAARCPLYPQKLPQLSPTSASAKGHKLSRRSPTVMAVLGRFCCRNRF
jgi:hypothetical protein